jgi:hypothetical protein
MATLLRILKHRVTITLLVVLGLATALELAAPPAIRLFAVDWLHDHGIADARIGAVRINPFTWSMSVYNLKAGPGLEVGQAAINIDWWPLLHHQIYVRDIALDHAHLELAQGTKGAWMIAGLVMPAAAPATADSSKPWYAFLHRVSLKDVHIRLSGHDLKLDVPIQSLDIDHAFLSQAGNQILNTTLRLGPSSFSGLGYQFVDVGLLLRGQLILPGPGASLDTVAARNTAIKVEGLTVNAKDGQLTLTIGHTLVSGVSMHGPASFKARDIEVEALQLSANPAKAADTSGRISLASIRKASLHTLSLANMNHATFARLMIRDIALPATKNQSMGSIGGITASDADIALPASVRLGRLDFRGLNLALQHEKNGMAVLNRLQGILPPSPPGLGRAPVAASASASTGIRIGLVTIDKGSNIAFTDNAVHPPFQGRLAVESFRLSSLDTSGKQPGALDAAFKLGDQGQFTVKGEVEPNPANPVVKLAIAIKRLSMPALSGYVEKDFGSAIRTGQMDVDAQWRIHNHSIDAQNSLNIRNLSLTAPSPDASGKASQNVGMPLDMAVSMLSDNQGNISLKVPVSGRLDDPNIHLNDVINQALASAIRSGAISYASLLLQPYGSILPAFSLASAIIGYASRPRLTPISFAPRTARLSDQAKAYIGKIAQLMKQKPLRLQVCGVASRAEMLAKSASPSPPPEPGNKVKDARLQSLASARSTGVIKALVAAGISPDRLFACLPKVDTRPDAGGRVELLLN